MTGAGPAAILVGPPGSGKSTVGPLLAARLRTGFLDTDDEVEAIARKPVGDIFVEDGEQAFRALEWPVVLRRLGRHRRSVLLARSPARFGLGRAEALAPRIRIPVPVRVHAVRVDPQRRWRRATLPTRSATPSSKHS